MTRKRFALCIFLGLVCFLWTARFYHAYQHVQAHGSHHMTAGMVAQLAKVSALSIVGLRIQQPHPEEPQQPEFDIVCQLCGCLPVFHLVMCGYPGWNYVDCFIHPHIYCTNV